MAAQSGADWLDTAPNYAAGLAEQEVSQVLARYSHVRVSTKVGFIPVPDRQEILGEGALTVSEAESGHNLSPDYVRWQVARSRRALGRIPDLVFLHNPEHNCPAEQANERLYAAFAALEQACADGEIHAYGVATWSGFSRGVFDIPTLLGAAFRAGGPGHHLRAVQLPLSLVHLAPIAQALEGKGVLADAHAAGIAVFASAPLHGGEVPGMVTRELLDLIAPDRSPAQAALSVVASAPGVRRVLLSTMKQEHWAEAVTALDGPVLSRETLKRITDVLGT
ncbi:aldo/keto reductase [Streptacidiphilus sp. P02-A3a]|uniref:aldo/keto reductase n=1 Tax=Streptacidiphilus sp. P02-A3a TaxID=2704468 RepID=UPI0015FE5AEC|nr:aldo/keto reductase [Streptacidiphilus sp. P02-A3a]QMU68110.1 aldo/keto reductase [Streptacidiphilus sp. P02-A3a]